MLVGPSRKAGMQGLADDGARAIAAREEGSFAGFIATVRVLQLDRHPVASLLEAEDLGWSFYLDAVFPQPLDEKPLVLILRENQHVGIRAQSGTDIAQGNPCSLAAAHPQVYCCESERLPDDTFGDTDLAVQLHRAGMKHQCARGSPRFGHLVDDAHAHTQSLEPKRQNKAGRSGTGDQDIGVRHCMLSVAPQRAESAPRWWDGCSDI